MQLLSLWAPLHADAAGLVLRGLVVALRVSPPGTEQPPWPFGIVPSAPRRGAGWPEGPQAPWGPAVPGEMRAAGARAVQNVGDEECVGRLKQFRDVSKPFSTEPGLAGTHRNGPGAPGPAVSVPRPGPGAAAGPRGPFISPT